MICDTCRVHPVARAHAAYTDEARHVVTEPHFEASADLTVREWFALRPLDPVAVNIAKQVARLEHFYYDYEGWLAAMGLEDTPESLLVNHRISSIWIRASAEPGYESRMQLAREIVKAEYGAR